MSDQSTNGERPTVSLPPNTPSVSSNGPGNGPAWHQKPRVVGLIIGIILLLLLIGFGVYAALRPNSPLSFGDRGGLFGELPLAEELQERARQLTRDTSGLSGMKCEHPNRRAVGVMLAGDPINRPVSGFAKADLVLEMPVLVSDVTRLTAFYQCNEPTDIGSVRSARHDYLFMAEGWDAILGHWGGSYHALNRIAAGEFQTINALSNPFNAYFRKDTLPAPYNGFTTYERLWNALVQLGYRQETKFEGYEFKDDAPSDQRGSAGSLSIAWPGQFAVRYEYDPATNRYQRFWAGVKQVDGEDNTTLVAPSTIAIMRAGNTFADGPGGYNDMAIEGDGPAEVYQDGQAIQGTWHKDERYKNDPVRFMDEAGNEITFTRGQVWVTAVEPHIDVTWTPAVQ